MIAASLLLLHLATSVLLGFLREEAPAWLKIKTAEGCREHCQERELSAQQEGRRQEAIASASHPVKKLSHTLQLDSHVHRSKGWPFKGVLESTACRQKADKTFLVAHDTQHVEESLGT